MIGAFTETGTTMLNTLTLARASAGEQSFWHDFWFREQAITEAARLTDGLYMFIFWTCAVSFIFVIGLMLFFTFKYRRKPGIPTKRSPSHNTPLELAWTIIPLLVMTVIFFWGLNGYLRNFAAPGDAEIIRVSGQQWNWSVTYANGREAGPNDFEPIGNKPSVVIKVPQGRPVQFMLSSRDVIHSFYIPAIRAKRDVFPNRYTSITMEAQELGKYEIFCAEYCGQDHAEMNAWLEVVSEEKFQEYLQEEIVIEDPVEFGKYLYRAKGCAACHSVDGSANTGPTWMGIYTRDHAFADGTSQNFSGNPEAFSNYIRTSVYDPGAQIVAGFPPSMSSYKGLIDQEQLEGLIAYMMSTELGGPGVAGAPGPAATGDDIEGQGAHTSPQSQGGTGGDSGSTPENNDQ